MWELRKVVNMPEEAWICLSNALIGVITMLNILEYARILNVSNAEHNIRSPCKLLNSYSKQRRIQNTVKHLRWSVLHKELYLSAGAQPEIFQVREGFVELGHFVKHCVKNMRRERSHRERFWSFFSYVLLKLHFEWKI